MSHETGVEIKKSVCVWCKGECGVIVHVKDGHLVKVEEDPDWPRKCYPPTTACVRRQAAREWFYNPNKVNFPLKRMGEKGEGKWQQISWEQALDEIAQKLGDIKGKYGGEGIAYSGGTGYRFDAQLRDRFFAMLGTPNFATQAQICFLPRCRVAEAIAGWFPNYPINPDKTKCIVSLGMETLVARPYVARKFLDARKNGAKLIVIDPRYTRSASMADVWLQPRPGTDCALLMGIINVIVTEELYDKEFVEKWCHGFEKLKERLKDFPLNRVASITQVSVDKIQEAARVYAANRPGCFVEGMGVEHLENVAEVLHARWILAGLMGNVDVEGGEEMIGHHPDVSLFRGKIEPRVVMPDSQLEKQIGADRFKFFGYKGAKIVTQNVARVWGRPPSLAGLGHAPSIYRAMITGEPYPVRAMWTAASNPMVTQGNIHLVYRALKSLDLYVVVDYWMTPSAELADYVLPPTCWLQRPMLADFGGYGSAMVAGEAALPTAIPGEYEHKGDHDIFRELAIRMGYGEYWPWKNLEDYYDILLKPTGYTHHDYVHNVRYEQKPYKQKKYEKLGFATPTGKVELYSTIFEELKYDPLPQFREPPETEISKPELAAEYPYNLITGGRVREFYHSEWHQIDSVRKRHPNPLVQIHPVTAEKHGISQGDWVWIETIRGKVKQKAELFDGIAPNVIHAEHAWSIPEVPATEQLHGVFDVNINVNMNDDPDVCNQITGGWPLKTALCKVYKVEV
ncbi:molybdopterin-dependent oxidoreductase [Chloroflexota bacterium]